MSEDQQTSDSKVKEHLRQTFSDKCSSIGGRKIYFGLHDSMIRTLTPVEEVSTPVPTPEISDSEFSQTSNGHRTSWTLSDGFLVHTASEESDADTGNKSTTTAKSVPRKKSAAKPNTLGANIKPQGTEHKESEKCASTAKTKLGNGSQLYDKDNATGKTKGSKKSTKSQQRPSDDNKKSANKSHGLPAMPACTSMGTSGERKYKLIDQLSIKCEQDRQYEDSVKRHSLAPTPSVVTRKTGSLPPIRNDTTPPKCKPRVTKGRQRNEDSSCSGYLVGEMLARDSASNTDSGRKSGFTKSGESRPGYHKNADVSPKLLPRRKENVDSRVVADRPQPEPEALRFPSLLSNKLPPIGPALPEIGRNGQRDNKSGKAKGTKPRMKNSLRDIDIEQLFL